MDSQEQLLRILKVEQTDTAAQNAGAVKSSDLSSRQNLTRKWLKTAGILAAVVGLAGCEGCEKTAPEKKQPQEQKESTWPPPVPVVEWSRSLDYLHASISLDDYAGNNKEQIFFTLISHNNPGDQIQLKSDPSQQFQTLSGQFKQPAKFFDIKAEAQVRGPDGQMVKVPRPINHSRKPGTLYGMDTNKFPGEK